MRIQTIIYKSPKMEVRSLASIGFIKCLLPKRDSDSPIQVCLPREAATGSLDQKALSVLANHDSALADNQLMGFCPSRQASPKRRYQLQLRTPPLAAKKACERLGYLGERTGSSPIAIHSLAFCGLGADSGRVLSCVCNTFCPQIPREKMFKMGCLIVFCGLLAQVTALLNALPAPLGDTLTPALVPNPTDLAGSLANGKWESVTCSLRCVCICSLFSTPDRKSVV